MGPRLVDEVIGVQRVGAAAADMPPVYG